MEKLENIPIFKKVKSRYISINEDILETLDPYALKVYMAIRYESDYGKNCSSVKKNIEFIKNKTKISKRQISEAMQTLEIHGLLKREFTPGYQTTYWIAQDLWHFADNKNKQTELPAVQLLDGVMHIMHGVMHHVHGVMHNMHDINNNTIHYSLPLSNHVDFQSTKDYEEDELFMKFYSIYPNKQKPRDTQKSFHKELKKWIQKNKLDSSAETLREKFVQMLCDDVKSRLDNNWKNKEKDFIPHPTTYLNKAMWEGELIKAASPTKKLTTEQIMEREQVNEKGLSPKTLSLVDEIFRKIALNCRGFDECYQTRGKLRDEKKQWIMALSRLKIEYEGQITTAIEKLDEHKYHNPPQLGQFLEWVKEEKVRAKRLSDFAPKKEQPFVKTKAGDEALKTLAAWRKRAGGGISMEGACSAREIEEARLIREECAKYLESRA